MASGAGRCDLGAASIVLALLYLGSYKAQGQIPPFNPPLPFVQFEATIYTIGQGQAVTIGVMVDGGSQDTVSVDYSTSDGTAVAGVDYTPTSGTLTFPPGTTEQFFTVSTLSKLNGQSSSTVNLGLSSPSNAILLDSFSSAVLTIVNDQGSCPSQ